MWTLLKRFRKKERAIPRLGKGSDTVDGRCLRDWLASAVGQVHENETEVRLGPNNYSRTFLVTQYPEGPAYLDRLNRLLKFHRPEGSEADPLASKVHVRLSCHLAPSSLPDDLKTKWLRNRQAGMAADVGYGTPDAATTKALRGYNQIYHGVAFNEDRVMQLWLAITVTAPSPEILATAEVRLRQQLTDMNLAVTPLFREQLQGFQISHVLGGRQTDLLNAWTGHISHTEPLSYLYPFLYGTLSEGTGIYTGHEFDTSTGFRRACYMDFTRGTGAQNWIVAGRAGEGKSTWVKAVIMALVLEGFMVIVYDPNGEYRDLQQILDGIHVDLTPASGYYFDPLVIPSAIGDEKYDRARFGRTSQLFHCILKALVPDLTSAEKGLADKLLMFTWAEVGVKPDDPATWGTPNSIHRWWSTLREHAAMGTSPVAESLKDKLEMYFDGSQALFKEALSPDWSGTRFVRISVSDKISNNASDEQAATVKTLMANSFVMGWVLANKHKGLQYAMIVMDEAQRVLRDPAMSDHCYQLATDGRKHNCGLSLAANDPFVFSQTEGGQGFWQNASLRCLFFMQESGLRHAATDMVIPEPVLEQLRGMSDTYQFMLSRDSLRWTRARLELPQEELDLYRTRGLRTDAS